ncbi:MAG: PfkB family carbohydrate kinase, partial [Demequina sp.]|uniref:PfkB family carbohydrate kinase n=1 Tax=Demequina sp. TaxID=2050685 RepID=UPI003A87B2F3
GGVRATPGGSPANVAVALGRLERAPRLVSTWADDPHGALLTRWLRASGVRVEAQKAVATSRAVATLDSSGAAAYEFDICWDIDTERVSRADVLHVGSVGAVLQPGATAVYELVDRLASSALTTYDPNIRQGLIDDEEMRASVLVLMSRVHVVKASDEDLAWIFPGLSVEAAAQRVLELGPRLVVATRGGDGMLGAVPAGAVSAPAVATAVIDTVGAGDTCMGALIDGLIDAGCVGLRAAETLAQLRREDVERILHRCAAAAAVTVSRPGADPPTREELSWAPLL